MAVQVLDCKGLPCPQPVLLCKQCIDKEKPATLTVLVDNEAARQNVTRFLGVQGYAVVEGQDDKKVWTLTATLTSAANAADCACHTASQEAAQKIAIFIASDVIGHGDDQLGAKLMFNFLATLPELGADLWRIICVNAGVKLAVNGSAVLEKLKALEDAGASVLVCGTCLDHFGLLSEKALGQTTNMLDVVTSLQLATKVIRP